MVKQPLAFSKSTSSIVMMLVKLPALKSFLFHERNVWYTLAIKVVYRNCSGIAQSDLEI